jgi:hypothetical protein
LKGRSGHSDDDSLKVYKGVFSTCNIENKNCRGWELSSKVNSTIVNGNVLLEDGELHPERRSSERLVFNK